MDWILGLCIASAVVVGSGLLLVIGFASGEDSSSQSHAHEVAILKHKITELENQYNNLESDWFRVESIRLKEYLRAEDLAGRLTASESIRTQYARNINELAREIAKLRKGGKDFALDA